MGRNDVRNVRIHRPLTTATARPTIASVSRYRAATPPGNSPDLERVIMHAEQLEKLETELRELTEKKEALEAELAPINQRIERIKIEIRYLGVAADHQII